MPLSGPLAEFATDVARDLSRTPKQLQPKYLYDALGTTLFEAICRLPWYRITRAEQRLLEKHADAIASALSVAAGAARITVVELGCGKGEKLQRLIAAIDRQEATADVHLIDVSAEALRATRRRLRRYGHFSITSHQATYEDGLERAAARRYDGPAITLFLGSNIGNFDPPDAADILHLISLRQRDRDLLLLGADLVKPERDLLLAYDDPLGVTAAFNKNLLVRMNRELGARFDVRSFAHKAHWNAAERRIEMHLVSRRRQRVAVASVDLEVTFEAGESIWTESSYKYEPDQIVAMGEAAGFSLAQQWIDEPARFALTLFIR
jgi:L-histidine Nalpha-methyltransferase